MLLKQYSLNKLRDFGLSPNVLILWPHRKFLTPVDKKNLFTVDHFPIWYRLAAENKPGQFFFYVPHDDINKGTQKVIVKWICCNVTVYQLQ